MSLQNYDPDRPKKMVFTFNSLLTNLTSLKKQVEKVKTISDELDVIKSLEDVKKNTRVQMTHEDSKKKYQMYQDAYKNLKADGSTSPVQPEIESMFEQIKKIIDPLTRSLASINQRCKVREQELLKEREEQMALEAEQKKKSLEQMQEEQMAADLEKTKKELDEIAQLAAAVNEGTHNVDNELNKQHEVVVKIDNTIQEAKEEMIAGNQDLEEASADQKAGSLIKTPGLGCCNIF